MDDRREALFDSERVVVLDETERLRSVSRHGTCDLWPSRFLEKHRDWEKDYIWVKMDHRWTRPIECMAELRKNAKGGIPWFAILDSDGKGLSKSPRSCIGHAMVFEKI